MYMNSHVERTQRGNVTYEYNAQQRDTYFDLREVQEMCDCSKRWMKMCKRCAGDEQDGGIYQPTYVYVLLAKNAITLGSCRLRF